MQDAAVHDCGHAELAHVVVYVAAALPHGSAGDGARFGRGTAGRLDRHLLDVAVGLDFQTFGDEFDGHRGVVRQNFIKLGRHVSHVIDDSPN